jgi:phosphonate transport system ATP-binding protein
MNGRLVMETLRAIASDTGLTVVTTLHHVEYARRYADRVLGLRDGRLVFDGPAEALGEGALRAIFGELPATPFAPAMPWAAPELATAAAS